MVILLIRFLGAFYHHNKRNALGKKTLETVKVCNRDKTKTYEATVLARHNGLLFVEHPTQGDGSPIMILQKDGTLRPSHAWDTASVYSDEY